jgi:hypothetical protein
VRSAQTLSRGRSGILLRGVGAHAPCLLWCPLVVCVCSPRMRRQAGEHTVKRNSIFFPLCLRTDSSLAPPKITPIRPQSHSSVYPVNPRSRVLYAIHTASAENCRTFFFSCLFLSLPPFFFQFFFPISQRGRECPASHAVFSNFQPLSSVRVR